MGGIRPQSILIIVKPSQAYFWSTYSGAEFDLLFLHRGKCYGVECKFNEAPKISKSMGIAQNDLNLEHLWIISPGQHQYSVDKKTTVCPLQNFPDLATVN